MTHANLDVDPLEFAPFPLGRVQAIHRATELHNRGWSWTSVALAMGEYHGQFLSAGSWRGAATYLGLPARKRPATAASRAALERLHGRAREKTA